MQNPIGEADLEWILHRNCEGTEQLQEFYFLRKGIPNENRLRQRKIPVDAVCAHP